MWLADIPISQHRSSALVCCCKKPLSTSNFLRVSSCHVQLTHRIPSARAAPGHDEVGLFLLFRDPGGLLCWDQFGALCEALQGDDYGLVWEIACLYIKTFSPQPGRCSTLTIVMIMIIITLKFATPSEQYVDWGITSTLSSRGVKFRHPLWTICWLGYIITSTISPWGINICHPLWTICWLG